MSNPNAPLPQDGAPSDAQAILARLSEQCTALNRALSTARLYDAPSEPMLTLALILSGHFRVASAGATESVDAFTTRVRHQWGYSGGPADGHAEWECRNRTGRRLDPSATVADAGVQNGDLLYVTPRPGWGS